MATGAQQSSKRQAELAQPVAEEMLAELLGPAVSIFPSPLHETTSFPDTEHMEPTLQDILTAVQTFDSSIANLSTEVKSMKEDLLHIRHDMQKIREPLL